MSRNVTLTRKHAERHSLRVSGSVGLALLLGGGELKGDGLGTVRNRLGTGFTPVFWDTIWRKDLPFKDLRSFSIGFHFFSRFCVNRSPSAEGKNARDGGVIHRVFQ